MVNNEPPTRADTLARRLDTLYGKQWRLEEYLDQEMVDADREFYAEALRRTRATIELCEREQAGEEFRAEFGWGVAR